MSMREHQSAPTLTDALNVTSMICWLYFVLSRQLEEESLKTP